MYGPLHDLLAYACCRRALPADDWETISYQNSAEPLLVVCCRFGLEWLDGAVCERDALYDCYYRAATQIKGLLREGGGVRSSLARTL